MSGALAMFRKTAGHDVKKSAQKVSDPKKDTVTRLRHLRSVLDNYEPHDAKKFFQENYSHIYYIFYDNFGALEADLKQRANKPHKAQREELESILNIFEKILFLLPELVQRRWMFHSIGRILKKLLHPGNTIKLRREGMRLFIIWYQILQHNASEECHQIFLQLVPGLGRGENQDILNNTYPPPPDSYSGMITAGEITPIISSAGEKQPDNITKYFLDNLLTFMVSEVIKIEWMNKDMREASFVFLFNRFKSHFLLWLLPDFETRDIYDPVFTLPRVRTREEMLQKDEPLAVAECRDSYIRWLTNFTAISKSHDNILGKGLSCSALTDSQTEREEGRERMEGRGEGSEAHIPGSNASTLSAGSQCTEKDSANSSLCGEDHSLTEYEIVRSVLYSTRENVNIVHECFRQALLFSFRHAHAMRRVIGVYKDWFTHVDQRPVFMLEPPVLPLPLEESGTQDFLHSSLSDIVEEECYSDDSPDASSTSILRQAFLADGKEKRNYVRNASYLGAMEELADHGEPPHDVKAGMQKVLQVFITNAANIFLLEMRDESALQEQVDLCKRVLNIYRHVVMNIKLNQKTWEQMLQVLLAITSGVLNQKPPKERHTSLGGRLAQPIFQTMIVTWIKANLNVQISAELWDQFLQVLSSLTSWVELIREWAKTMETLTRVLARQVYGLDLNDLPLARLSEQKEKRRRGKESIKTKPSSDKGFARSWSRSDGQVANVARNSLGGDPRQESPFDRVKYKSDGAGGTRNRPELPKQRSLSGEPSPAHSRSASTASELVRSSSEGNIADARELIEKLQGTSFTSDSSQQVDVSACAAAEGGPSEPVASITGASAAVEDQEVAAITTTCTAELASVASGDHSLEETSLEKSDSETVIRASRSPSPLHSGSRTPSPSSELVTDSHTKDSPTPDRDSLHIDMVASTEDTAINVNCLEPTRSVMAGGPQTGWQPDVAVVLWRRMLGCLGDVNQIEDPEIHAQVFDYLCDLLDTMLKLRDNLGVTQDNMSSPPPPELLPPLQIFVPWLFECLTLSNRYKRGKLLAYQLICQTMVCRHDVPPSQETLCQFYRILHHGLVTADQDVPYVLVRYCGPRYFSAPLPGALMLMLDFLHAAGIIIAAVDVREPPRAEAVAIVGSLVCFPNHFGEMPVLEPITGSSRLLSSIDMKDQVINLLLRAGKREPAGLARCIAVSSIGIFLYEELYHSTLHPKIKDAINVLLAALKCVNKGVAKIASDMLHLLCDHVEKLLSCQPQLPRRIVDVIASTISTIISSPEFGGTEEEKRLIVSMMFCMVEWAMKMPVKILMDSSDSERSCMYRVFRVLHSAVTGHSSNSLTRVSKSLADVIQDSDFENMWETGSTGSGGSPRISSSESAADFIMEHAGQVTQESRRKPETDIVKLAARTLMTHLVNHLSHFPMGAGAARLNTTVQEHHDLPDMPDDDLKTDVFNAPNVQFFVLNHRSLVSFIELPAVDAPGGGVTAGLTTAKNVCRVIIRDLSGKFCWESSVLYSPPWCKLGSSRQKAKALLEQTADLDLEPLIIQEDSDLALAPRPQPRHPRPHLPVFASSQPEDDNVHDMLQYIGTTSPECLLRPGQPLNIPAPLPAELGEAAERSTTDMVLSQQTAELAYYQKHKTDVRQTRPCHMLARPQMPADIQEPFSPFQMCRLLLDQMGLLSWDKRSQFDLLKKSDRLIRELKNLDNQKCRDTHKVAVLYVAEGQEDKNSILSNSSASRAFEDFVAGLGWEIDLESHQGFLGGLQQNRTTGDTAPYYANSSCEVVFHVSTRFPMGSTEALNIKMRHLGNDDVHIVWSEHTRDYRRGIIPTQFGDIIIVIYPIPNGLYRIQINKQHDIPFFGPLFDGAIVDHLVLPGLVRATAINASHCKRQTLPFYHSYYEERAKCLETVIQQHIEHTTFEDFAANVFAPVLPSNSTIVDNSVPMETHSSGGGGPTSDLPSADTSPAQLSPASLRQSRGRRAQSAMWQKGVDNLIFL